MKIRLGDAELSMSPIDSRASRLEQDGFVRKYLMAFPEIDVFLMRRPEGIELAYLIRRKTALPSWKLHAGNGISGFHIADGRLIASSSRTGAPVLILSPPILFDSGGKKITGAYRLEGPVLSMTFPAVKLRYPVLIDPFWSTTGAGALNVPRRNHTATPLPGGKVLVAGGTAIADASPLSGAEVYDSQIGAWSNTGSMSGPRANHAAVLLPNGKILALGGSDGASTLSSAELYDPAAGTWSTTGAMGTARKDMSAVLLPNGKVLVAGGSDGTSILATAEIYNPSAGTWSATSSLTGARKNLTLTLLADGKILAVGGTDGNLARSSAELYDPVSGRWSATGSLNRERFFHIAARLLDGKVLVAGGTSLSATLSNAELYDPVSKSWSDTGFLSIRRSSHSAVRLPDGRILVAGGHSESSLALSSSEIYDPASGTWTRFDMQTARAGQSATLLVDGRVLLAGGAASPSVETLVSATGPWSKTTPMRFKRRKHTLTMLPNGKVFALSGTSATAELYDPVTETWSDRTFMDYPHTDQTATLLPNGKILVVGGASAEIYDPEADSWSLTGPMHHDHTRHTATPLLNGKVLVAGGDSGGPAEIYDPVMNSWSATGSMNQSRQDHAAALLMDGKVFVSGGNSGSQQRHSSTEIYDPASGTWFWAPYFPPDTGRSGHSATLMPNGKVLLLGGDAGKAWAYKTGYLYSPDLDFLSNTPNVSREQTHHSVILLPNGWVWVNAPQVYAIFLGNLSWFGSPARNSSDVFPNATLLQDGRLLTAGGGNAFTDGNNNCETAYYNEYPAPAIGRPRIAALSGISASPVHLATGSWVTVTGSSLTGISQGDISDSFPASPPGAYFLRMDVGNVDAQQNSSMLIDVSSSVYTQNFSSTTLQIRVPHWIPPGHYHFWVQAQAVPSNFVTVVIDPPPPPPPGSLPVVPPVSVSASSRTNSMRLSWSSAGNLPMTPYKADLSTKSDFSGEGDISSTTLNTRATFSLTQLSGNTTYYFRVKALGGGEGFSDSSYSTATAMTAASPPTGSALQEVSTGHLLLNWSRNGNNPETTYEIQLSTTAQFSTVTLSTSTAPSAILQGLLPNSSYYIRVRAASFLGTFTPFDVTLTTLTAAAAPSTPSFTQIHGSSLTVSWLPASNPQGTAYTAQLSKAADFAIILAERSGTETQAHFDSLTPLTTYFARVKARNNAGRESESSPIISVQTPQSREIASSLFDPRSIRLDWSSDGSPQAVYSAELSTTPHFTGFADMSSTTLNLWALFEVPEFSLDTTYYLRLRRLSPGPASPYDLTSIYVTRLKAPLSGTVQALSPTLFRWSWSVNGNPSGTLYRANMSRTADFSIIDTSSLTAETYLDFTVLDLSATYYLRVQGAGMGKKLDSTFSGATFHPSRFNPPLSGTVQTLSASVLQWLWSANGNPPGLLYQADISRDADFGTIHASSLTSNTHIVFNIIGVNTTHYMRVKGTGMGLQPDTIFSSRTFVSAAKPPDSTRIVAVTTGSVIIAWLPNGNPEGTEYEALLSPALSRLTRSTTAAFTGLYANQGYTAQVRARNYSGTATEFDAPRTTFTRAQLPRPIFNWVDHNDGSIGAACAPNNNGGSDYLIQLSSMADFSGEVKSVTLNGTQDTRASFYSLSWGTTYYLRVRITDRTTGPSPFSEAISTVTLPLPPFPPAQFEIFQPLTESALNFRWSANRNPYRVQYQADISTNSDFTGSADRSTVTLNTRSSFSFPSLPGNTRYYGRAKALGGGGQPDSVYAQAVFLTDGKIPVGFTFKGVTQNGFSVFWSSDTNGSGTLYETHISLSKSFATFWYPEQATSSATGTSFQNLEANTTYYVRVRGIFFNGIRSDFNATSIQLPNTLAPPSSPTAAFSDTSTIRLSWSAGGNSGMTLYQTDISTASNFTGFSDMSKTTADTQVLFAFATLQANTTYYLRVQTLGGGEIPPSPHVTTSILTPANAPIETALLEVTTGHILLSWNRNGNPSGTRYQAQIAGRPDFIGPTTIETSSQSAAFPGLVPNTAYSLRVRAVGATGTPTAYDMASATLTLAASPTDFALAGVFASSLTLSWSSNGNPENTDYQAQASTVSDFSSTVMARGGKGLQLSMNPLSLITTYYLRVRAVDQIGRPTAFSDVISTKTKNLPPRTPHLSGLALSSSSVRWQWDAVLGAESFSLWSSSGGLLASLPPQSTHYLETGLFPSRKYDAYLEARNEEGSVLSSTVTVGTPASFSLNPDAGSSSSATLTSSRSNKPVLDIPAGALTQSARWLVSEDPLNQPLMDATPQLIASANAKLPGGMGGAASSAREYLVTDTGGRYTGIFGNRVTVYVEYPDADGDGFLDGVNPPLRARDLKLYTLDEQSAQWLLIENSEVDTANKLVRAPVPHLSIYTALATYAADLSELLVFPNPWRPGSGGAFDATGVKFLGLSNDATIQIFTLSGRLVKRLEKTAPDGNQKIWDGTNEDGRRVASGVYYYLVLDSAGHKVVGRLAVLR